MGLSSSGRVLAEAHLDKLCALADAQYYNWHARALRPDWDRRLAELEQQKVSSGRALKALRITQEQLVLDVRERIAIYEAVARERSGWGMLSKPRLDDLRRRIKLSVGAKLSSLRSRTARQAAAVGYAQSALPPQQRYDNARDAVLTTGDTALAVLRAEGSLRTEATAGANPAERSGLRDGASHGVPSAKRMSSAQPAVVEKVKTPLKRREPDPSVLPMYGTVSKTTAARALGRSIRSIERMVENGTLAKQMHNNIPRFKVSDLRAILDQEPPTRAPRQTATR